MAVTTIKGHVSRALDFFNKPNIYLGIGRTTPWEDDSNPPRPQSTDDLTEVAGYKKAESIFMVKPDDKGELTYRNQKWKIIPIDKALEEGARWVYVSTFVAYSELPTKISYRQVAAISGLQMNDDVPAGQMSLLPNQVKNVGITEVLDNRTPIYREADQREQLVLVIEF